MSENEYKHIIEQFISQQINVEDFVDQFFAKWKSDRDNTSCDPKFRRLIDRLFTSCDCYFEKPENQFDISEEELRKEVGLLYHIWWG